MASFLLPFKLAQNLIQCYIHLKCFVDIIQPTQHNPCGSLVTLTDAMMNTREAFELGQGKSTISCATIRDHWQDWPIMFGLTHKQISCQLVNDILILKQQTFCRVLSQLSSPDYLQHYILSIEREKWKWITVGTMSITRVSLPVTPLAKRNNTRLNKDWLYPIWHTRYNSSVSMVYISCLAAHRSPTGNPALLWSKQVNICTRNQDSLTDNTHRRK